MNSCVHGINEKYCVKCKNKVVCSCLVCKKATSRKIRSITVENMHLDRREGWLLCCRECEIEYVRRLQTTHP